MLLNEWKQYVKLNRKSAFSCLNGCGKEKSEWIHILEISQIYPDTELDGIPCINDV